MSVYALRDPRTGACRYIGRSRDPHRRLRQHIWQPSSVPMHDWISDLDASGLAPAMEILGDGTEADWIKRLQPDLNRKPGDGPVRPGREDTDLTMIPIKLTLTHEDADLIAAAMKAEDERMTATWVRKVALRAARAVLAEKKGGRR